MTQITQKLQSWLPYGSFLEHFPLAKSPMPTFSKYPITFATPYHYPNHDTVMIDIDVYRTSEIASYYENYMVIESTLRENTVAIFRVKKKREPLVFNFTKVEPRRSKTIIEIVIDIDSHMWKNSGFKFPEEIARILKFGNVATLSGLPLCYYGIKLFINGQEKKTGSKESASGYVPATGEDSEGRKDFEAEGGGDGEGATPNRAAINRRAAYKAGRAAEARAIAAFRHWPD